VSLLRLARDSASGSWWALTALLSLTFALGGSARGDVPHLIVLRPAAALLLGYGLLTLRREHLCADPLAWFLAAAIVALPVLQLIPLPPALWQGLPGRGLIAEIDRAAGLAGVWRPLSLTPLATRNALFACLVPLAAFVLGMQLGERDRARLLPLVLLLGGVSALAGLVQIVAPGQDWLYFYPITNVGSEVGLFANRNHQAALLAMMLPMLAVLGILGRARSRWIALGGAVLLIPLILVAGSRFGLVAAILALAAIPLVIAGGSERPLEGQERGGVAALAGRRGPTAGLALAAAGVALIGLTIWQGRGEAWTRLTHSLGAVDQRVQIVPTLGEMFAAYFPVGTGMGSFERVFQIHESDTLLGPAVVNHAHNDWIEVVLDGGVAAAVLLGAGMVAFAVLSLRARKGQSRSERNPVLVRLGLLLVGLQAAASLFDYPLRTPIHAVLFTVAILWTIAGKPQKSAAKRLDTSVKTHRAEALAAGGRMP
jgi:O-antigen ligase